MTPELPVECLRFDAPLARAFQSALDSPHKRTGKTVADRQAIPDGPDATGAAKGEPAVAIARPQPGGPPRLAMPSLDSADSMTGIGETSDWLSSGSGVVSLPEPAASPEASLFTPAPPARTDEPVTHEAAPPAAVESAAESGGAPSGFAWFGSLVNDVSRLLDRRRHRRVPVSFDSRMALVRMKDSRVAPIRGEIVDLSISGLGVRMPNRALGASRGAFANAVVSVELDMPGPEGPLLVAGHVRRIDIIDAMDEARIGIEFVLLTEPDRVRLERAIVAGSAPAGSEKLGTLR
jgi:hypothetical protein